MEKEKTVQEMLTEILRHYSQREAAELIGVPHDTLRPWLRRNNPVQPSDIRPIAALYRAVTADPPKKVDWALIVESLHVAGLSEKDLAVNLGVGVKQVKGWRTGQKSRSRPRKIETRKRLLRLHKKTKGRA